MQIDMALSPGLAEFRQTAGRAARSLLPLASLVDEEPQASIRPAKQVDDFPAEIETSQTELGDCLVPIERKSEAQVLIRKQLFDDLSNARL
jgi:hypothetical protein